MSQPSDVTALASAPAYNTRSHGEGPSTSASSATGALVARMETILETVAHALSEGRELRLGLMARRGRPGRGGGGFRMQEVRFPGRSFPESQKFARLLLIIQLSHDALVSGTVLTKRHIYYQHQELFERQRVVDELVDDLAATLAVQRDDLNIVRQPPKPKAP
ncbi:Nad dependent epimerase dehydratase family protein [Purpureocillium lavendulum]|uniref:Nad dependent epimerase dehydratase family protein n=1 Tax=Purpureocillium lavendulum TaxID=1247861 RepID=A0AB34FHC8_9HYPO|nr:Nad dependent epimerase dehydratase family protein [Purpureocillium lavendulum]